MSLNLRSGARPVSRADKKLNRNIQTVNIPAIEQLKLKKENQPPPPHLAGADKQPGYVPIKQPDASNNLSQSKFSWYGWFSSNFPTSVDKHQVRSSSWLHK